MEKISSSEKTYIFVLVMLSACLLFFNLGQRSLWEPDEGRYAEIAREMLESGDWLTPRLNYIKHFDKPPITYWLIASSFKLFGQNEFAGHLPLISLGLLGVLVTFFLGKKLFGQRIGFLSAIILVSSLGYPAGCQILSTDIVFTFFVLLGYLFFIRKNYLLFFFSMAMGFMTKGPVVLIITLIPVCVFLLWERKTYTFKEMPWGKGLLLFAAVALPWFIYQTLLNDRLFYDWAVQQTVNRIIHRSEQPFYFFIPVLIGLFFPWIFFAVSAGKRYLSFKRPPANPDSSKVLLLFLWFILPFLFFSCIGKKLMPYILPLLPALAIMVARFWDEIFSHPKLITTKIFTVSYYILLLVLIIFFTATTFFVGLGFDDKLGMQAIHSNVILMSIILGGASVTSYSFFRLKKAVPLFVSCVIISSLFFLIAIEMLPKIEVQTSKSIKTLALKIKEDLRPEDKVVNYRCFLKSLPFYLARRIIVVERERNIAYEEDPNHWRDYLLQDKQQLYTLLATKDFKVYCITYTWEWENIRKDYSLPIYLLAQAGKYVLFTNKE